jgi:hypothetical protein
MATPPFLRDRLQTIRRIFDRRWVKITLGVWALIAAYDTFSHQVVPEKYAQKLPRVWDAVAVTSGWLTWWQWSLVLAAILVLASFEYAHRVSPTTSLNAAKTNEKPSSREFTVLTAHELLGLYKGRTWLQADRLMEIHKGLWIDIEGRAIGIYADGKGAVAALRTNDSDSIECRFGEKWRSQLDVLPNGALLKVRGKISSGQNGQRLYLLQCELRPDAG